MKWCLYDGFLFRSTWPTLSVRTVLKGGNPAWSTAPVSFLGGCHLICPGYVHGPFISLLFLSPFWGLWKPLRFSVISSVMKWRWRCHTSFPPRITAVYFLGVLLRGNSKEPPCFQKSPGRSVPKYLCSSAHPIFTRTLTGSSALLGAQQVAGFLPFLWLLSTLQGVL